MMCARHWLIGVDKRDDYNGKLRIYNLLQIELYATYLQFQEYKL